MGVKERKERDKIEMRDKILHSAGQLFLEQGFEQISIRNIAEAIEYSPATIYLYFKDKNEIIHALHQKGFRQLNDHFEPLAAFTNPFERLVNMGKAYIRFATTNPAIYDLLFMKSEPMQHVSSCLDEEWKEGDNAFEALLQTIMQCQQHGYFNGLEPHSLAMMIWSSIHGLCSLHISCHLGHVKEVRTNKVSQDDVMMNTFATFTQVLERLKN